MLVHAPERRHAAVDRLGALGVVAHDLKAARDHDAQWLVIGTHGRTGFKRVAMGSVAEVVVRKAPCSVLVVRVERPS